MPLPLLGAFGLCGKPQGERTRFGGAVRSEDLGWDTPVEMATKIGALEGSLLWTPRLDCDRGSEKGPC